MSAVYSRGGVRSSPYPPFALPGSTASQSPTRDQHLPPAMDVDSAEDFPPIEHFLDEMPSIESLVAVESERDSAGWLMDEWHGYDLSSVAALATQAGDRAIAEREWSSTQWENENGDEALERGSRWTPDRQAGLLPPAALEVADALDGIAHRIRSGELVIDKLEGMAPEAAMAAALAVVLRLRR